MGNSLLQLKPKKKKKKKSLWLSHNGRFARSYGIELAKVKRYKENVVELTNIINVLIL